MFPIVHLLGLGRDAPSQLRLVRQRAGNREQATFFAGMGIITWSREGAVTYNTICWLL
jgi:hypothetical protein